MRRNIQKYNSNPKEEEKMEPERYPKERKTVAYIDDQPYDVQIVEHFKNEKMVKVRLYQTNDEVNLPEDQVEEIIS